MFRRMRKPLPAFAIFKCLQLKIINMPKQHISGWQVLSSDSRILDSATLSRQRGRSELCQHKPRTRGPQTRRGKEFSPRAFPYGEQGPADLTEKGN